MQSNEVVEYSKGFSVGALELLARCDRPCAIFRADELETGNGGRLPSQQQMGGRYEKIETADRGQGLVTPPAPLMAAMPQ